MKFKPLIILSSITLSVCLLSTTASACTGAYFSGGYRGSTYNQSNARFYVQDSAIGGIFTANSYQSIFNWNGKSSKVKIAAVLFHTYGMPSYPDYFYITGKKYPNYSAIRAEVKPIDFNGNIGGPYINNLDWSYVSMSVNTNSSSAAFNDVTNASVAAKKVIMHEVGHVLKLEHPDCKYNAVMRQGFIGQYVANTIQSHDINNLRSKWGN